MELIKIKITLNLRVVIFNLIHYLQLKYHLNSSSNKSQKVFKNCVVSNKSQKALEIVKHSQVLWSFPVYKEKKITNNNNNGLKDIF